MDLSAKKLITWSNNFNCLYYQFILAKHVNEIILCLNTLIYIFTRYFHICGLRCMCHRLHFRRVFFQNLKAIFSYPQDGHLVEIMPCFLVVNSKEVAMLKVVLFAHMKDISQFPLSAYCSFYLVLQLQNVLFKSKFNFISFPVLKFEC